nr:HAMP domain-containing sensor histidine kinase [Bradyrhizobium symbiodeficiens]AWM06139.1 sensor histidine kinase [Bradyrhizobium symbiodeficiens]
MNWFKWLTWTGRRMSSSPFSAHAKQSPIFTAALPHSWTMTSSEQHQGLDNFESVLLAIAGHDLRQPLQIVQGALDLLGVGVRTRSELRHLQASQRALDQLNEQLAQLLVALRMRLHAHNFELSPVHVQQLLRQACKEHCDAAQRKGIKLRVVSSTAAIVSDSLLMGAALRNLVGNAVRYTQEGGRIVVGCRRIGAEVRIDVYDSGIGVSQEEMPKIFEAFTRLDTGRPDGLGVGLFIVRHAVRLLRHRIEVASTPSRGSRFSILAPLHPHFPG